MIRELAAMYVKLQFVAAGYGQTEVCPTLDTVN
jgi:hypothetical protein